MDKEKSVFKCAAENGISFGIYLSVIFFTCIYGTSSFLINSIGLIMILAAPLMLFRYMRKFYKTHPDASPIVTLWNLGIFTSLFGSLICALVTYIWLQYITPTFIIDQAKAALAVYEQYPDLSGNDLVISLRKAIEENLLPTPIVVVLQLIWFTTSLGVVGSLIMAPLAKIKKVDSNNNI